MASLELPGYDVVGVRADNPGAFTLDGTNSWIVDRNPAWLVDPGPALDEHVAGLVAELERRGGLGGIALTHDHADHTKAVPLIRRAFPSAPLAAARGEADVALEEGTRFGPLEALRTPGHAPDHVAFVLKDVAFTGDAVLGTGSVFIAPDPGALTDYLDGLRRLRARDVAILGPGHGPLVLDAAIKLDQYIAHRLERERKLLAALAGGERTVAGLLDEVWGDAPVALRPAATVTLAAHLDKLADEGRLPLGVERPAGFESLRQP